MKEIASEIVNFISLSTFVLLVSSSVLALAIGAIVLVAKQVIKVV